jgi:uncharacterized Zn finger protein
MWWESWDGRASRPRKAKGGIKAKSKRGDFGESWWARRWIDVLEGFDIGARLGRGRSYARQGQVLSIHVEKGLVRAKVQGSRPKPYEIAIQAKALPREDWKRLSKGLASQAIYAAKLLAGEMPQDIEKAFEDAGLSLFPTKIGDLATKCSCPDWSNPCKHIAAVYYLLGEEFDRDPFLIFTLRGLTRDELLDLLAEAGASADAPPSGPYLPAPVAPLPISAPPSYEPLSANPSDFWKGPAPLPDDLFGEVRTPPVAAALPRRLGGFPFWRGDVPLLEAIEPSYARASTRGLDVFVGDPEGGPTPGR